MVKLRYKAKESAYAFQLTTDEAKQLLGWMQLSAVCLQTWPVSAHELLTQAKAEGLI